ncbi:hypothetical protein [Epinotia aporema granulovirus]|uniref:Uncharacterized protein n=1 Tax=Epinotia aporema granulovirus TaxID=166056 RepID=K4EQD5_9BBAC|nr:hypothetical protein [Epinotia aporema granulovirus]AER41438.1 hypothetical protein [Epinotia aporema granulovirus]
MIPTRNIKLFSSAKSEIQNEQFCHLISTLFSNGKPPKKSELLVIFKTDNTYTGTRGQSNYIKKYEMNLRKFHLNVDRVFTLKYISAIDAG